MTPGFLTRAWLAFVAFFKILFDARFAGHVLALRAKKAERLDEPAPAPKVVELPKVVPPPVAPAPKADPSSALQLLAILQREGRFVDFLQEDVSSFADADVGAAARLVHDGCQKALAEYVRLEPLRTEGEGAAIHVQRGFDPSAIRLTGNVTGEPPFSGTLRHHGWRAVNVKLPPAPADADASVVAPAEVEL